MLRSSKKQKTSEVKVGGGRRVNWSTPMPKLVLALIVVGVAAIGTWLLVGSHAATANTYYMSPSGSDSNVCSQTAPCLTMKHTYAVASPGDTVYLLSGTYSGQTIGDSSSYRSSGPVITFMPAPSATVSIAGQIYIFSSYVTLSGLTTQSVTIGNYDQTPGRPNPQYVTLQNLTGRNFEIDSASNITVQGGSWGPATACGGPYPGDNNSIREPIPGIAPTNILIDSTVIHDIQSYNLTNCHIEGLAIFAGSGVTVSNSKFYGNSVYDIFMQANSGGSPTNITLSNNSLAQAQDNSNANGQPVGHPDGIALGNELSSNVTITGNHLNDVLNMNDAGDIGSFTNVNVSNNYGMMSYNGAPCGTGIVYTSNVWTNNKCGSTDTNLNGAALPYVNPTNDSTLDYTIIGSGGGGGDTTKPTVSLTAPTSGATVTGNNVTVSANASDNVGVASVQFQLDGANLGSLDTTSPYTTTWDSTTATDGTHTLTAIAKDAAGNTATSSSVSVTVSNNVGTPGCTTNVSTASAITSAVSSAASGSTICVASGSYGAMTWTGGTSRTSKVIVKPASGATVTFTGTLTINGSQIEVQNISLAGQLYQINGPASDIQMTNVTAGHFIIEANGTSVAQNITIKGGSIGPWNSYPDNWIVSGGGSSPNKNIMIDGVTIHDFEIAYSQLSTTHFECLQVWAADGLTIQNSTFKNCSVFDIFLQSAGSGQPPAPTNVLIQNNFLDCCSYSDVGYRPNLSIEMATDHGEGSWNNVTIRNNSGDDGIAVGTGVAATFSGDVIENNILPSLGFAAPSSSVPAGVKVDYNEWYSGSKVGTHDLTGASTSSLFGATNFANKDFHLASGAPVIGKADPTAGSYPSTDIDGNPRPASNGPDIGANEPPGTAPPTCTTGTLSPPTGVGQNGTPTYTTIGLKWTAPSPTSGCTITGYKVFRNGSQIGTTTSTSYNDSGLNSGTSYNYSVEATDSGPNTSAQSSTVSLSTAADDQAPNIPGSPAATSANPVVISWSGVTDLPSAGAVGVKGYNIYRCTGASCSPSVTSTPLNNNTPLTTTSFSDSTVAASTTYRYVITAVDNNGNESAPSNPIVSATTPTPPPTCANNPTPNPSPAPGAPTKTSSTDKSLSFSWTASAAATGCTLSGYHIYRADAGANPIANVTSGTTYTDSNLTPNTSYTYTIEAFDTSSHTTKGTAAVLATAPDTSAPSTPGSVVATATSSSQVSLGWSASSDDVGVTNYRIYRSDKGTTPLATVSGTTLNYVDSTVTASNTYTYQVSAVDSAGNASAKASSNSVSTPSSSDNTAPSAPSNVAAPIIASQSANLSWSASTDNVGVAGYHVYLNGVYAANATSTNVTLSCLAPNVAYTVTVKAYDSAGNSSNAGSVPVHTLAGGLSGDFNCDTRVSSLDLSTLATDWQQTGMLPIQGDSTGDGKVNSQDLSELATNWGK